MEIPNIETPEKFYISCCLANDGYLVWGFKTREEADTYVSEFQVDLVDLIDADYFDNYYLRDVESEIRSGDLSYLEVCDEEELQIKITDAFFQNEGSTNTRLYKKNEVVGFAKEYRQKP